MLISLYNESDLKHLAFAFNIPVYNGELHSLSNIHESPGFLKFVGYPQIPQLLLQFVSKFESPIHMDDVPLDTTLFCKLLDIGHIFGVLSKHNI